MDQQILPEELPCLHDRAHPRRARLGIGSGISVGSEGHASAVFLIVFELSVSAIAGKRHLRTIGTLFELLEFFLLRVGRIPVISESNNRTICILPVRLEDILGYIGAVCITGEGFPLTQ